MKIKLSCPSKTFILGEYLVLNHGSALVLNTLPRFELLVNTRGDGIVQGISHDSPAGHWVRQNKLLFSTVDIEFIDPHYGMGGFGASSAQFLLASIVTEVLKNPEGAEVSNIENIWRTYRQMELVSKEGLRPSGADIIAQYAGGLTEIHIEPMNFKSFKWPLEDYCVLLAHTGHKMATHEHLRGLKKVSTEELEWIYARALEMMSMGEAIPFFDSVNDYYGELLELGLVSEATQVIVTSLMTKPFVRAAKGCGAMGSDVVAIFVGIEDKEAALSVIAELELKLIADSNSIEKGFEITIEDETNPDISITKERLS